MSESSPGECRSNDCTRKATYFVELVVPKRYKRPERAERGWGGEFCYEPLVRVLPEKVKDVRPMEHLTIERMYWL